MKPRNWHVTGCRRNAGLPTTTTRRTLTTSFEESAMKMAPELYRELKETMRASILESCTNNERARWDLLFYSGFNTSKLYDAGLDDSNISTALRKITEELKRELRWSNHA